VQTIANLAGAKTPADWDGASLVGWLDKPGEQWKDLAVSEYYGHNIASGFTMIRRGQWKYVYHTPADQSHPAQRELYDLGDDPGEFQNLAGEARHKELIADLHATMVKEVGEDPDRVETRCRQPRQPASRQSETAQ
jgi:choline-sulfatase